MYQWLVAWRGCITALREHMRQDPTPVIAVGIEADDVGNLDDVVLYRDGAPTTYCQVKYAVDARELVNGDYLLAPSRTGGPSILAKIAQAWQRLTADGSHVDLAFITTRAIDPQDTLASGCDTRTSLLTPKAENGSPRSNRGRARIRWAKEVGLSEADLLAMLQVLRFEVALTPARLLESALSRMGEIGLKATEAAAATGIDWIARQVRDGHRRLEYSDIAAAVTELELREQPFRTTTESESIANSG